MCTGLIVFCQSVDLVEKKKEVGSLQGSWRCRPNRLPDVLVRVAKAWWKAGVFRVTCGDRVRVHGVRHGQGAGRWVARQMGQVRLDVPRVV